MRNKNEIKNNPHPTQSIRPSVDGDSPHIRIKEIRKLYTQ